MQSGRKPVVVLILVICAAVSARAEIIDRILAVVEGQLITLSDVRAVTHLRLETPPPDTDPIEAVLERLIDRQLVLIEVDRYAPPEPSTAEIDAQLQAVQQPYGDALGLEIVLGQVGWARDDVRRYVRDELRIQRYLRQRFEATIQPTDDEVAAYYRLHADEFTRGGSVAPYSAIRDEVRNRFIAERRSNLVRDWLAGLRRRANIQQLYLASAG